MELCNYCNKKETLLHLYWTCPLSKRLWERLKEEIKEHLGIKVPLIASECLLNIHQTRTTWKKDMKRSLRILYLLCKHYIHLSKCAGDERSQHGLIGYITRVYNMEYNISQHKGSVKLIMV